MTEALLVIQKDESNKMLNNLTLLFSSVFIALSDGALRFALCVAL